MNNRPIVFKHLSRAFLRYIALAIGMCICLQIVFYYHVHGKDTRLSVIQVRAKAVATEARWNVRSSSTQQGRMSSKGTDQNCQVRRPASTDVHYIERHWQQLQSSNGTFYLYRAYYDVRRGIEAYPTVRILAMINRLSPPKLFCQLWFHHTSLSIQTVADYHNIWSKTWKNYLDDIFQPYFINCPLMIRERAKADSLRPKSVSIYEEPCSTKLTNHLPIDDNYVFQFDHGMKDGFAVCVKALDFPTTDLSFRLIEWVELLKLVGANRISFYHYDVHPYMNAVLKYYQKEGFIHLQPMSLPGTELNVQSIRREIFKKKIAVRRQQEVIPYNDCFYRNMYHYRYIVLLDIDEIILPLQDFTWIEMLHRLKQTLRTNETYAAISARHVYFFHQSIHDIARRLSGPSRLIYDQIPYYFHMLKQIERTSIYTKPKAYVKTFFDSEHVIAVHNHYLMGCFGPCYHHEMDTSLAHLQHYRNDCVVGLQNICHTFRKDTRQDTRIWRYRSSLINEAMRVARKLHLIH